MALVLGTSCGFVEEAPVDNPSGESGIAIDTQARAVRDTSPATATTVTEIGWYARGPTEEADFEGGIYTDEENDEPEDLVDKGSGVKGESGGWYRITGLNIPISSNTVYWLAIQLDDTTVATAIDREISGGTAGARITSQTDLPADWGTSATKYPGYLFAIYAVWEGEPPPASTTAINIGDEWKSIAALKINIGDAWKAISAAKINIGDVWKVLDIA